jgi:predicted nucleic acid-binding protein
MIAVKIVIDTYAWIELLIGSERGKKVKEQIENAQETYTPGTVLTECARKFLREGTDEKTIAVWLEVITAASVMTQIDSTTALEAAKCQLELAQKAKTSKQSTPSLFDAIVLATARINQCKILTGDEHFKDLPETIWVD